MALNFTTMDSTYNKQLNYNMLDTKTHGLPAIQRTLRNNSSICEVTMAPVEGLCSWNQKGLYYPTPVQKSINPGLYVSIISGRNSVYHQAMDQPSSEFLLSSARAVGKLGLHHGLSQSTTPYQSDPQDQILTMS